ARRLQEQVSVKFASRSSPNRRQTAQQEHQMKRTFRPHRAIRMWRVPAVAIVAVVAAHAACAQVLPGRPITVVVPFPPGASADAIMRLITHKITENIGQQFVIDNRTGGAASVSAIAVKQAPPDGHTL